MSQKVIYVQLTNRNDWAGNRTIIGGGRLTQADLTNMNQTNHPLIRNDVANALTHMQTPYQFRSGYKEGSHSGYNVADTAPKGDATWRELYDEELSLGFNPIIHLNDSVSFYKTLMYYRFNPDDLDNYDSLKLIYNGNSYTVTKNMVHMHSPYNKPYNPEQYRRASSRNTETGKAADITNDNETSTDSGQRFLNDNNSDSETLDGYLQGKVDYSEITLPEQSLVDRLSDPAYGMSYEHFNGPKYQYDDSGYSQFFANIGLSRQDYNNLFDPTSRVAAPFQAPYQYDDSGYSEFFANIGLSKQDYNNLFDSTNRVNVTDEQRANAYQTNSDKGANNSVDYNNSNSTTNNASSAAIFAAGSILSGGLIWTFGEGVKWAAALGGVAGPIGVFVAAVIVVAMLLNWLFCKE